MKFWYFALTSRVAKIGLVTIFNCDFRFYCTIDYVIVILRQCFSSHITTYKQPSIALWQGCHLACGRSRIHVSVLCGTRYCKLCPFYTREDDSKFLAYETSFNDNLVNIKSCLRGFLHYFLHFTLFRPIDVHTKQIRPYQ